MCTRMFVVQEMAKANDSDGHTWTDIEATGCSCKATLCNGAPQVQLTGAGGVLMLMAAVGIAALL